MPEVLIALLLAAIDNAQVVAKMVDDHNKGVKHTPEDLDALTAKMDAQSQRIQELRNQQ